MAIIISIKGSKMQVSAIDTLGMMTEINHAAPYEVQLKSIGNSISSYSFYQVPWQIVFMIHLSGNIKTVTDVES